jgi:DNA-binding transcriptional ArsR family regulator
VVRSPSNVGVEIEVWDSVVIELILTISAYQHPFHWDSLEAGRSGFQRIKQGMSPELRTVLADLDFTGPRVHAWGALAGWSWKHRLQDLEAAAAAVEAAPDADAATWMDCLPDASRPDADLVRNRVARAIRLWRRDLLGSDEAALRERLHQEAEAKRELARQVPMERLIELATNGIVWRPQPGVERVVLVPCAVMSPWSNHDRIDDALLFTFPLVDGMSDPLQRIQRLSWVLADRSRLAALRLLAERTLTLQELADELGVRKSTMHHHLALLRAAGLLRVPFGTKAYSLRREPLSELSGALNTFGRDE